MPSFFILLFLSFFSIIPSFLYYFILSLFHIFIFFLFSCSFPYFVSLGIFLLLLHLNILTCILGKHCVNCGLSARIHESFRQPKRRLKTEKQGSPLFICPVLFASPLRLEWGKNGHSKRGGPLSGCVRFFAAFLLKDFAYSHRKGGFNPPIQDQHSIACQFH